MLKPVRRQWRSRLPARRRCQSVRSAGIRRSCAFWRAATPQRGAQLQRKLVRRATVKRGSHRQIFPSLAGQSPFAIYKQLHDYRTDARVHPQMTTVAKRLSPQRPCRGGVLFRGGFEGICGDRRSRSHWGTGYGAAGLGGRFPPPHSGVPELPSQWSRRADRNASNYRPEQRIYASATERLFRRLTQE